MTSPLAPRLRFKDLTSLIAAQLTLRLNEAAGHMLHRHFVWTKMQTEAGQRLEAIIARKEIERISGSGLFFWGIGNSLGKAVSEAAREAGGTLPVLWSMMKSKPKAIDASPGVVRLWEAYEDASGKIHEIPPHATVTSRVSKREHHYALVCHSETPLSLGDSGPFDPTTCKTTRGKSPGASQVTALLQGDTLNGHKSGSYRVAFRALLVSPWAVKLVRSRILSHTEVLTLGL